MKKFLSHSWLFPNCFFIFFSIYLLVKFIFIFFFSAAFEPQVIFELTPLCLLSGFSNSQLLSLSLMIMALDMYLHLRSGKRNLLISFFPTSVMIASVGYAIMFSPMDITYIFHYLLFGLLLLVLLIDYQYVLKGVETPTMHWKKEPVAMRMMEKEPLATQTRFLFAKHAKLTQQPMAPLIADSIAELKKISDTMLQKMQIILEDLDRKTLRIEQLENEFYAQQRNIAGQQKMFLNQGVPSFGSKENVPGDRRNLIRNVTEEDTINKIILKEKIENHLIIDDKNDIVAVVQRGTVKEISNSFADFLGYERTELLQKNFFVFIAPRGFEETKQYYLNRLKGVTSQSFRTVLLSKARTELYVEITVTPTVYDGDSAEFLSVKEVKNN